MNWCVIVCCLVDGLHLAPASARFAKNLRRPADVTCGSPAHLGIRQGVYPALKLFFTDLTQQPEGGGHEKDIEYWGIRCLTRVAKPSGREQEDVRRERGRQVQTHDPTIYSARPPNKE